MTMFTMEILNKYKHFKHTQTALMSTATPPFSFPCAGLHCNLLTHSFSWKYNSAYQQEEWKVHSHPDAPMRCGGERIESTKNEIQDKKEHDKWQMCFREKTQEVFEDLHRTKPSTWRWASGLIFERYTRQHAREPENKDWVFVGLIAARTNSCILFLSKNYNVLWLY